MRDRNTWPDQAVQRFSGEKRQVGVARPGSDSAKGSVTPSREACHSGEAREQIGRQQRSASHGARSKSSGEARGRLHGKGSPTVRGYRRDAPKSVKQKPRMAASEIGLDSPAAPPHNPPPRNQIHHRPSRATRGAARGGWASTGAGHEASTHRRGSVLASARGSGRAGGLPADRSGQGRQGGAAAGPHPD